MNEELQPLQPIGKKSLVPSTGPASQPPGDPSTRLTAELIQTNALIKALTDKIDRLEQRGTPATAKDLAALVTQVKAEVRFTIDYEALAREINPEIGATTKKAAQAIDTAAKDAVDRISQAANYSASYWAGRIGFASWLSALVILGVTLLVMGGSVWYATHAHEQAAQAAIQVQGVTKTEADLATCSRFAGWIRDRYPKVWNAYIKESKRTTPEKQ